MIRLALILLCAGFAAGAPGVPLVFVANRGQAPPSVRYLAQGSGLTAWFLPRGIRLRVRDTAVEIRFEGASHETSVEGFEPLAGRLNFLIGAASQWHRDLPTFAAVRYRHLYPGIDMIYAASEIRLKSEFMVAPGADPGRIRIRYSGAGPPMLQPDGALAIATAAGRLVESPPWVYQECHGATVPVEGRYLLSRDGTVGFDLGRYDPSRPLVIDPSLSYSALVGNSGFTAATAIAVDSSGAAYLAGYTDSSNLPTANPAQNFNAGSINVFVAKLDPSGTSLEYCTYMGGSEADQAYGIAVTASGAAVVTGTTTSRNFPTVHALENSLQGSRSAFVFKLNPAGDMLEFSTYLGGNGADVANGVALDPSGNVYLVGDTTSTNFPARAFQTANHGSQDAFIAKLSANGQQLVFGTYLGGSGTDHGAAIATGVDGSIYVTGSTWSSDFPVKDAFQSANGGSCDAFLVRLSADGDSMVFGTYLGGSGGQMGYPETGQAIALDAAGDAYVAGVTSSADFPLRNALQPQLEGFTDAFVTAVNSSGSLLFSTYMGGSGVDYGNAVALDASGAVFVAGYTYSTDFPVTEGALQTANGGGCDAFLFKLSPAGDVLLYATYLGGIGSDTASGVALDAGGNIYLAGWTMSANFPMTLRN